MRYLVVIIVLTFMNGCEPAQKPLKAVGSQADAGGGQIKTDDDPNSADTQVVDPNSVENGIVVNIEKTELFTLDAQTDICTKVEVVVKEAGAVVPEVEVAIKVDKPANGNIKDSRTSVTTNELGHAEFEVCSTSIPGLFKVSLSTKVGEKTYVADVPEVTVITKPDYNFVDFTFGSDILDIPAEVYLNLFDAGEDCTTFIFRLTKDGMPVAGETILFHTEVGTVIPAGVKLAVKEDDGAQKNDPATDTNYAVYEALSDASGKFIVPFCAGFEEKVTVVRGTFVDEFGFDYEASTPPIRLEGGQTNYGQFSHEYLNSDNYYTIWVNKEKDESAKMKFNAKMGTASEKSLSLKNTIFQSLAERGKVTVATGGIPNAKGEVAFDLEIPNLRDNLPLPAYTNTSYGAPVDFPSSCDANDFNADPINYEDYAKNWRVTVMYYVQGQEQFKDHNNNKKFDVDSGDGFNDINQNGRYDAGTDILTYDWKDDNKFAELSEWFIDLPSPFIDGDEDGHFSEDLGEQVVGTKYIAANGKWDSRGLVWKSFVAPVFQGMIRYSAMQTQLSSNTMVQNAAYQTYHTAIKNGTMANYNLTATLNRMDETLMYDSNSWAQDLYLHFLAQGKCGSPLPGGTALAITTPSSTGYKMHAGYAPASLGRTRKMTYRFYSQPHDEARLIQNRLLINELGGDTSTARAEIGPNLSEHPLAPARWPIMIKATAGVCKSLCTGPVEAGGLFCPGWTAEVTLEVKWPTGLTKNSLALHTYANIPEHNSCVPYANTTGGEGVYTCLSGTKNDANKSCD